MMETSGIDVATTQIPHSLYKGVLGVACVQLYSVIEDCVEGIHFHTGCIETSFTVYTSHMLHTRLVAGGGSDVLGMFAPPFSTEKATFHKVV